MMEAVSLLHDPRDAPGSLWDPFRWGLDIEAIQALGQRLYTFWYRVHPCCTTRTRDTGAYAYHDVSGLLRMDTDRLCEHRAPDRDSGAASAACHLEFTLVGPDGLAAGAGGACRYTGVGAWGGLLLDESTDEKAGAKSAGAGQALYQDGPLSTGPEARPDDSGSTPDEGTGKLPTSVGSS